MMNGRIKKYQQGLSLIELMISLVIGLLLTAAVLQTFISSRITYSVQTELAKLQENARFAMTYLRKDFRAAGYIGCKPYSYYEGNVSDVTNKGNGNSIGIVPSDWFVPYELDNQEFPESDSIWIRLTESSKSCYMKELYLNEGEYYFECESKHEFNKDDPLVATDCKHLAIFYMSNDDPKSTRIEHSENDKNCVSGLGKSSGCSPSFSESYSAWEEETVIQRFNNLKYEIAKSPFGTEDNPIWVLQRGGEELVEGVEKMQIDLGIDTDDDNNANCFASDPADCGGTADDVVSIRINLLMVSLEDNIIDARPSNEFSGTAFAGYTPSDRKLRKVVVSTITLRNRLI